jgi:hypothetical protein
VNDAAGCSLELRLLGPIADAEIDTVRRQLRMLRSAPVAAPPRGFMVITPLGMPHRDAIAASLTNAGIEVAGRSLIDDWPRCSTFIYPRTEDDERLRVAIVFERAWRAIGLSQQGERWDLARVANLDPLSRLKAGLRARFGTVRVRVVAADVSIPTPNHTIRLQPIHVPEPAAAAYESHMLDGAISHQLSAVGCDIGSTPRCRRERPAARLTAVAQPGPIRGRSHSVSSSMNQRQILRLHSS